MRLLSTCLLASFLLPGGCFKLHTTDPKPVVMGTASIANDHTQILDKVAGYNEGAQVIANTLPDSTPKTGILKLLVDQRTLTGDPTPATKAAFDKLSQDLLSAQADTQKSADMERASLLGQNQTLTKKLADDTVANAAAIKKLTDQHQIDLDTAAAEGDKKVKEIASWIFFGLSALCALGAIAVAVLASSYPLFGPKAAIALGLASVVSLALGALVTKLLAIAPIYWGLGLLVVAISTAVTLICSNHHHASTAPVTPVPKPSA